MKYACEWTNDDNQLSTRRENEKRKKALNELKASIIHLSSPLNVQNIDHEKNNDYRLPVSVTKKLKRKRINTCLETMKKTSSTRRRRSNRCEVADGRCSNLQIVFAHHSLYKMISAFILILSQQRKRETGECDFSFSSYQSPFEEVKSTLKKMNPGLIHTHTRRHSLRSINVCKYSMHEMLNYR